MTPQAPAHSCHFRAPRGLNDFGAIPDIPARDTHLLTQVNLGITRETNEAHSKALSEFLAQKLGLPNDRGLMCVLVSASSPRIFPLEPNSSDHPLQRLHRPREGEPGVSNDRAAALENDVLISPPSQLQRSYYRDSARMIARISPQTITHTSQRIPLEELQSKGSMRLCSVH